MEKKGKTVRADKQTSAFSFATRTTETARKRVRNKAPAGVASAPACTRECRPSSRSKKHQKRRRQHFYIIRRRVCGKNKGGRTLSPYPLACKGYSSLYSLRWNRIRFVRLSKHTSYWFWKYTNWDVWKTIQVTFVSTRATYWPDSWNLFLNGSFLM